MYQVYCDGQLIHDPRLQGYQLVSPSLSLELNKTGTFTFTMYPDHPGYGVISKLKSIIEVKKDGAVLFRGRPLSSKEGFYKQLDYTCEGELEQFLRGKNALCDYLADLSEREGAAGSPYRCWSRAIWDVTVVGWLLNGGFMRDALVSAPIPQYDHHYSFNPENHLIRYVYHIERDRLFEDLFRKLADG